jgi:hypothetical protein
MQRRTKVVAGALVAAVAVGGAIAAGNGGSSGGTAGAATTATTVARVTAKVTRQDLIATTAVGGTLTYGTTHALRIGSSSSASSSGSGSASASTGSGGATAGKAATTTATASTPAQVITGLPALGSVISRGQSLVEVNGGPGPALLYGPRPMWRTLVSGVTDGVDVAQLELNLVALGFNDGGAMVADNHFNSSTTRAIDAWQASRGLTQTGSVAATDVVYDSGPVRVATYVAAVGDTLGGSLYNVTGTTRSVQVALDPANQQYVTRGGRVTVTLPDTSVVDALVSDVGTVATVTTSGGGGGGGSNQTVTIPVTVRLLKPARGALDESPVTVNLVTTRSKNVLAVPVNALLALAEGGYALEKVNADGSTTLVKVSTGMFANGFVAVNGAIQEGDTVVSA